MELVPGVLVDEVPDEIEPDAPPDTLGVVDMVPVVEPPDALPLAPRDEPLPPPRTPPLTLPGDAAGVCALVCASRLHASKSACVGAAANAADETIATATTVKTVVAFIEDPPCSETMIPA